jgi:hypothetical protein
VSRPDPIEYAERLYAAIRAANFSTLSFLAFGNAVKDGVDLRRMPHIAAEPFMRVVGEMLDLEEALADEDEVDAVILDPVANLNSERIAAMASDQKSEPSLPAPQATSSTTSTPERMAPSDKT